MTEVLIVMECVTLWHQFTTFTEVRDLIATLILALVLLLIALVLVNIRLYIIIISASWWRCFNTEKEPE